MPFAPFAPRKPCPPGLVPPSPMPPIPPPPPCAPPAADPVPPGARPTVAAAGASGAPTASPGTSPDPDATGLRRLLLPGWLDSGPGHWQSLWARDHDWQRVEQDDWIWPRRGDWMARLDEVVLEDPRPVVLAAHSLGCHLVAAWAAHSRHAARVQAALLVAPPDVERADQPPNLHGWRPSVRTRLPFPALAVISRDDPYAAADRAEALARDWGASTFDAGPRGHLNGDSGLGDWPLGRALVARLLAG